MLRMAALASGSNGNCYFFESAEDAILIDAGVSCKQILDSMQKLELDHKKLKALFISHEHIDHVRGMGVLSRKLQIPVYITNKTLQYSPIAVDPEHVRNFQVGEKFEIGNITVQSFSKKHDAIDPCSFSVSSAGCKAAVMTDLGNKCENVISHVSDSDALFLETNYDDNMLENGRYPVHLKRRIASDNGHLSNFQASVLVLEHASKNLKHVFLSHLSANNNTPELAYDTFKNIVKERHDLNLNVIMTSRYSPTELLTIQR